MTKNECPKLAVAQVQFYGCGQTNWRVGYVTEKGSGSACCMCAHTRTQYDVRPVPAKTLVNPVSLPAVAENLSSISFYVVAFQRLATHTISSGLEPSDVQL